MSPPLILVFLLRFTYFRTSLCLHWTVNRFHAPRSYVYFNHTLEPFFSDVSRRKRLVDLKGFPDPADPSDQVWTNDVRVTLRSAHQYSPSSFSGIFLPPTCSGCLPSPFSACFIKGVQHRAFWHASRFLFAYYPLIEGVPVSGSLPQPLSTKSCNSCQ